MDSPLKILIQNYLLNNLSSIEKDNLIMLLIYHIAKENTEIKDLLKGKNMDTKTKNTSLKYFNISI